MARIAFVTDVHHSRSEPECRGPTYPLEVLEKLHEVGRLAEKLGAAILCGGDLLDRKGRATFEEVNDLLSVFASWRSHGIEVAGILGNHDIQGAELDYSKRAAGALPYSGAYRLLDGAPLLLEDEHGKVHVTGTSYFHGSDRDDESRLRSYGAAPPDDPEAVHVHVAHGALVLEGDFVEEHTKARELVPLLAEAGRLPDVILCGHLHWREGVLELPRPDGRGTVRLVRCGSLARVARQDLKRVPAAVLLVTRGRAVAIREVPIGKPVSVPEVVVGTTTARQGNDEVRDFVRKLAEQGEAWTQLDDDSLLDELASKMGTSEAALARARKAVAGRK